MNTTLTEVPQSADDRRAARWALHHFMRRFTSRQGGRLCMSARSDAHSVDVAVDGTGIPHLSGVQRCGSVHVCPLCAPTIRENRARQINRLLTEAMEAGCRVVFLTATVSHQVHHSLDASMTILQRAWSSAWSGRAAQWHGEFSVTFPAQARSGARARVMPDRQYVGQVRTLDVTYGVNGWHPHFHTVLIFSPDADPWDAAAFIEARGEAFRAALRGTGRRSAAGAVGWNWEKCESAEDVSNYCAKVNGWGVNLELARSDLKSHGTGRTFWQLLQAAADGETEALALVAEYETATLGRQCIVASRHLAESFPTAAGLAEPDDAEGDCAGPGATVVQFLVDVWNAAVRDGYAVQLIQSVIDLHRASTGPIGST